MSNEDFLFEVAEYENGKEFFEIWEDSKGCTGFGEKVLAVTTDVHVAIMIAKAFEGNYYPEGIQIYQMENKNGKRTIVDEIGNY